MLCRVYVLFFILNLTFQQSYSQAVVVRPLFGAREGIANRPGVSSIYFSMGRVAVTPPKHQGLSFDFTDENPDFPRYFDGILAPLLQDKMTEYEIGIADIHTRSNFVLDLFQYAWGRSANKSYLYNRISTGMGFQLNLGQKIWLRQVNYIGFDWLGNILLDNIATNGGVSGNLWLNGNVYYSNEESNLRLLIRQRQISYRPQISLGLKFSEGLLLSLNAGYFIPLQTNDAEIILKGKTGEGGDFSKISLSANRINLRKLDTNTPTQASSFQLNRWYVGIRLAIHTFNGNEKIEKVVEY